MHVTKWILKSIVLITDVYYFLNTILFLTLPRPVMLTSTRSPSSRYFGFFIPIATPDGVPVNITVPTCNVVPWLQKLTIPSTPNSKSPVEVLWRSSPFTSVRRWRSAAVPKTEGDTSTGPRGANLSKPLLKHHCGTLPALAGSRCQPRAETSLETQYPAT